MPTFVMWENVAPLCLLLLLNWTSLVNAEFKLYDMVLAPDDRTIYHSDGFIRGPGYIDLKGLTFQSISKQFTAAEDIENLEKDDDEIEHEDEDEDYDGRPPPLVKERTRALDGGVDLDFTTLDILIFRMPSDCANTRSGCDWTELGIGNVTDDGQQAWCCGELAIKENLCSRSSKGRLIVDKDKYRGRRRFIEVARTGDVKKHLRNPRIDSNSGTEKGGLPSGHYEVIFANCNEDGREMLVTGHSEWKSVHGYLPGELYGFLWLYSILCLIYVALLLWYSIAMCWNVASRIPIEKWILMTVVLGLVEMMFRTGGLYIWNAKGYPSYFNAYVGILAGALKRGISRCLVVMVALGWGVVRDSLGTIMRPIVVLGATYIGVSSARDLMVEFVSEDYETLDYNERVELFDVAALLSFVVAAVDVIFILWILDALNNTMDYLENMGQSRKLMRYLRLRTIFLFSILFATVWAVFALVNTYDEQRIVQEEHSWVVNAATEINYLFVLVGVAILWMPNPNAKEYAYVMELPAIGAGGDEDGDGMEMGPVPSAMDDDDDDGDEGGFKDDGHDERFKIDG